MLLQEGMQRWIAAGEVSGLFPAPTARPVFAIPVAVRVPPPEPVLARPAVPVASASAAAGGLHLPWLRITAGAIGLCMLVLVSILIFGRRSDRPKTIESIAQDAEPTLLSGQTPVALASQPQGKPDGLGPVTPDIKLPPVGKSNAPPTDTVATKFKIARAAYLGARSQARQDVIADLRKLTFEASDKAATTPLKWGDPEYQKLFNAGKAYVQGGGLPSHPALQASVAEYWRTLLDAARKFGEAADEGLAAYEKARVTDPARLRPLLAARLAARHANLLGVWSSQGPVEIWVIDFDERTGGLQVAGINKSGDIVNAVYRGENIEVKDGILSFIAAPVDLNNGKVKPGGGPTTMTLQDGKLSLQMNPAPQPAEPTTKPKNPFEGARDRDGRIKKPVAALLEHTDEEKIRESIVFYLKKGGDNGLEHSAPYLLAEAFDIADTNAVWRRLALRASFAYYPSKNFDPIPHEALYLPYRSKFLTALTQGPFGGMVTDMLTGSAPGAGVVQSRAESLLDEYEALEQSPHPYLKQSAGQALALCRARLRLAQADDQYGNTPASSIREFLQTVIIPGVQYCLQREADANELRESLQSDNPNVRIIVRDAPMSAESREKLQEFLGGLGGLKEDMKNRAVVSGLLAYADMAEVDRTAAFWQTWLLPLARRSGGPVSDKPLVKLEAHWRDKRSDQSQFKRVDHFPLYNVSGQDLTHVVVEMIAESEWGEKVAQYYYFAQLEVADFVRLLAHPRWDKRRLDFTNTMTVTWSVWADQGSETGRQMKLTSPAPNPDPAAWRKDYLGYDRQYQAEGEALGVVVQNTTHLPVSPDRLRRLQRDGAAPGTCYGFRLAGDGKTGRTLILRFLRFDRDQDTFEAEIFDPSTHQPFRTDTPVWKGKLGARAEAGIAFGTAAGIELSWAFGLVQGEFPQIFCTSAGKPGALFPARDIPLFSVKVP
jgi:hypothetical protein